MLKESSIAIPLRGHLMIRETAVLVGIAVVVPFLIHLIPAQTAPWGARLLPMFWAPLLGVVLYRLHVALIPAVLAPVANVLLTGSPAPALVTLLTIELVSFAIVACILLRTFRGLWITGPVAYLAAKVVSMGVIAVTPWFSSFRPATAFALTSVETAVPGLLILTAITIFALQVRARNKRPAS